jgi:hypothetical protein
MVRRGRRNPPLRATGDPPDPPWLKSAKLKKKKNGGSFRYRRSVNCDRIDNVLRRRVRSKYWNNFEKLRKVSHTLVWHGTCFLKFLLTDHYNIEPDTPEKARTKKLLREIPVDRCLRWVFSVVNDGSGWKRSQYSNPHRAVILKEFDRYCELSGFSPLQKPYLSTVCEYEADSVLSHMKNMTYQMFEQKTREAVNKVMDPGNIRKKKPVDEVVDANDDDADGDDAVEYTNLLRHLNQFKTFLEEVKEYALTGSLTDPSLNIPSSLVEDLQEPLKRLQEELSFIPHQRTLADFHKRIKGDPLFYQRPYLDLAMLFEKQDYGECRPLPLSTSFIQPHIPIDTAILSELILGEPVGQGGVNRPGFKKQVWKRFFNLSAPSFRSRSGLQFCHYITTDGFSIRVHLETPGKSSTGGNMGSLANSKELYFDQPENLKVVQQAHNIVVADPNKRDILFFRDKHGKTLRFTQNQLRVETKRRLYSKRLENLKRFYGIEEMQRLIGQHTHNSIIRFGKYLEYMRETRSSLAAYYSDEIFVRQRWYANINRRRCEDRLIQRIRKRFGPLDKIVIVIGDYNHNGLHQLSVIPTMAAGWRRVFTRAGITWFLLNEFRTSSFCPSCHQVVQDRIVYRQSPRPYRANYDPVHGLLLCQSKKCLEVALRKRNRKAMDHGVRNLKGLSLLWRDTDPIGRYFNRDVLACANFFVIIDHALEQYRQNPDRKSFARPAHLSRGNSTVPALRKEMIQQLPQVFQELGIPPEYKKAYKFIHSSPVSAGGIQAFV